VPRPELSFPGGRRFAFTVFDDTDVATVENVAPVYALLHDLGMRTTKTVWPLEWPGTGSDFAGSQTLEDEAYLAFVHQLATQGFEIASHGATMESSTREETARAHEVLRREFGTVPRVYANHANNRENIYWGTNRLDVGLLRLAYARVLGKAPDFFQGEVPGSPYWWGDLCAQHHEYVRNLTFDELDVLRVNPTMPYHDPTRPHVRWWFSATDAEDCDEFVRLFTAERIDALAAEGGVCILATHLGKGYARGGAVQPAARRAFERLASANGWFVPVGELLDHLRTRRDGYDALPSGEWRRMQWRWALSLVRRRLRAGRSPLRQ
jgi:hypothetical protein